MDNREYDIDVYFPECDNFNMVLVLKRCILKNLGAQCENVGK